MAINDELNEAKRNLEDIRNEAVRLTQDFTDIGEALNKAMKSSNEDVSSIAKRSKSLTSSLSTSAKNLSTLSAKGIKDQKNIAKQAASARARQLVLQSQIKLVQDKLVNASEEEQEALLGVLENLIESDVVASELVNNFQSLVNKAKDLDKQGGYFKNAASALREIPVIGPLLASGFQDAREGFQDASKEQNIFKKGLLQISAVADAFFLPVLGAAVFSLTKADSATTDLAKQLSISKDEAKDLRGAFDVIARDSGVSALNSLSMAESMIQLGDTIGATAGFTNQQVISQTKLTRMVGLQEEEAAKLAEFGILNEKSTNNVTTGILEQVALLEKETGIRLEGRKILSQVAAANGQLAAQYGFNTKELARAVVQSNRLGLSLEQSQTAASGLLDFESSISDELSAELLTGKNLNLERARSLALQGKSAEAASEIANQMGSASEFAEMNVIQQESLAKAANMSVAELADVLKKQEVLSALGEENFDTLMQTEEGRKRINEIGGEQLLQQLEQQSAAQKFQQSIEKLQASLGAILEGPLGGILDAMSTFANSSTAVYATLIAIGAISLAKTIGSIISLAATLSASAVAGTSLASALTLGLGAAAVIGGIIAIGATIAAQTRNAKKLTTEDDMIMPAGYGDRIISSPKGTVALNNQDTIVAGTNLGQGSNNQETKRTNSLLETLIMQNNKKQKISPVGLYHIQ
jgi:hypothetical protein